MLTHTSLEGSVCDLHFVLGLICDLEVIECAYPIKPLKKRTQILGTLVLGLRVLPSGDQAEPCGWFAQRSVPGLWGSSSSRISVLHAIIAASI